MSMVLDTVRQTACTIRALLNHLEDTSIVIDLDTDRFAPGCKGGCEVIVTHSQGRSSRIADFSLQEGIALLGTLVTMGLPRTTRLEVLYDGRLLNSLCP